MTDKSENKSKGEGDYDAARRYNDKTEKFVESGDADEAAGNLSGKQSKMDREALDDAKGQAKEHDPEEKRDYKDSA